MCCSIRGAVFFLASVHIFFSITQMVVILPVAVSQLSEKVLEASLAFVFCVLFFSTGFMTFRGADEESATLIRLGSFALIIVIVFRFTLLWLQLLLIEQIPEASFLYVYGTQVLPVGFTIILYTVYLAILFCYYKELKHESGNRSSVPFNVQSPRPYLRSHFLSSSRTLDETGTGSNIGTGKSMLMSTP